MADLAAPVATGLWLAPDLPAEQPLPMPVQDLDRGPLPSIRRPVLPGLGWRRGLLLGGSIVIGVVASCGVAVPLALDGFDLIDRLLVFLSLVLYVWLGFGLLNAAAGLAIGRRRPAAAAALSVPQGRVAVLVPIYNEAVEPLGHRLTRMADDLARLGVADGFDLFILSDSGPAAEAAERALCRSLRRADRPRCFYRRRAANVGRKPGNIADWITRFGGAYPYMLVLDADSLMTGDAMLRLADALERDPALGLVQTPPLITGAATLFARWQQFAVALYGPVSAAGLAWWSGEEATFWGHNAMLRTRAFAESCGLPPLPGAEPLGGPILSHDMVEAALLRRRGWRCRLLPVAVGSFEETPPTMVDHAIRDRRWCQGNLQHLRLLDAAGLHWVSRLQLLMGATAYLTSPMWLAMLVGGLFVTVRTGTSAADLGTPPWLVALTLVLLFGTRLLALAAAALDGDLRRRLGGWRAILPSVVADTLLSILAAPAIMASQSIAVLEIASGRPSGWSPQRRHSDGIALGEALDRYRWHMLLGLMFWVVSLSELGGGRWSLPVALGLLGAPFLATITSRADLGAAAARWRLFATDPATAAPAPTAPAPSAGWIAQPDAAAA